MEFKFVPDLVKINLVADNQKQVIHELSNLLVKNNCVSEDYADKVLEREKEYPTGLQTKGPAIAIPHAFDDGINGNHVAIGVLSEPVLFNNMEDIDLQVKVKLVFMLAISSSDKQLVMLQFLMKVFQNEQLLNAIVEADSGVAISDYLNEYMTKLGE